MTLEQLQAEMQSARAAMAQLSSEVEELRQGMFGLMAYLAFTSKTEPVSRDALHGIIRQLAAPETSDLTIDRTVSSALQVIEDIQRARPAPSE